MTPPSQLFLACLLIGRSEKWIEPLNWRRTSFVSIRQLTCLSFFLWLIINGHSIAQKKRRRSKTHSIESRNQLNNNVWEYVRIDDDDKKGLATWSQMMSAYKQTFSIIFRN